MMKQPDCGMGTSCYKSNMAANSSGLKKKKLVLLISCDLISIVFTLFIVEYRINFNLLINKYTKHKYTKHKLK